MAITYTVKKGDTLNSIVQAQGFKNYKEAGITSVPSGNFDLIRPGEVITIGNAKPVPTTGLDTTGTKPPPPVTATNIDSAINGNQNQDFTDASAGNEPPVRNSTKTYNDIYNQITTSLTKGLPEKPESTSMVDTYKAMLADKSVTDLENQLNDLQAQARDIQAISISRTNAEKGKAVPMNVISGRVSEAQQQENEKLLAVNNSIKTITDQLNTKYNSIESIMKYTGQDYTNAVDAYDKQFSQNMQVMNMVKGMVDTEKSDLEREEDNARANLQIIYNNIPADGITDPATQASITKLELKSGLPVGFYENITSKNLKADILSTTTREDGTNKYADVVMRNADGSLTTKTVSLGKTNLSASNAGLTAQEVKNKAFDDMNKMLDNPNALTADDKPIKDANGFLTKDGLKALIAYGATQGLVRADILSQYGSELNSSNNYSEYGLTMAEVTKLNQ